MSRFVKKLNKYAIATAIYVFFGLSLIAVSGGTSIAATATTKAVTGIAYSTATGNGSVLISFYVTAYGVCWNTTGTPTLADTSTNEGSTFTNVDFSSQMSNLSPGTRYFVRVYAREWLGAVSYGDTVEFTTRDGLPMVTTQNVTDIGTKNAMGHGTIVDLGISNPTQHGVCWNEKGSPSIDDKKTQEGAVSEAGPFVSEMKRLKSNKTYYVRAYATNTEGTAYGNEVTFSTSPSLSSVTTQDASDVDRDHVTAHGTVMDVGAPNPHQHGFCWNTTGMPDLEDHNTQMGDVDSAGPFSSLISGLEPDTTFYVRAYATNTVGTSFGDEISFTTLSSTPIVSTGSVTDIGPHSASGNGAIIDLGVPNPQQHGVCWNTSGGPTIEDERTTEGPAVNSGVFVSIMSGLLPVTTYYVKAYATNDAGTAYGDEVSFTTSSVPPLVSTDAVTEIATHSAIGNGTIIDPGIPTAFQHGVCWNTSGNPGFDDSKSEQGPLVDIGEFSSIIDNLLPNTTYFVIAYATSTTGTSFGNEVSFRTATSASAPIATLTDTPGEVTRETSYAIRVGGIGVVSYKYRLDTHDWSEERLINDSIYFELDEEGRHTLSVIGKNDAEMWQAFDNPTTLVWDIDTTPPEAELYNYPLGNSNSTGAEVMVGGLDVVSYRYRIDDAEWSAISLVAKPIDLSLLSEGEHSLSVIGADYANNWQNETNAAHISWTNDTAIPTAVLRNVPGDITNQTTANMTVTSPENGIPIDAYAYTIDDGHTWWNQGANEAIELTGLSEEDHTLCLNAFGDGLWQDGADGMSSTDNATCIQWRVDVTPANPAVLSVESNAVPTAFPTGIAGTASAQLSWTWNSDDELEVIQRYRVWYSEEPLTEEELDNATELFCDIRPGIERHEEVFSISGLVPAIRYYFGVKSIDGAGNLSDLSNVVTWVPEDQLPGISTLELTNGGMSTDNAKARELTVGGDNFLETVKCNIVRFENESFAFDFVSKSGTTEAIYADIPVGSPPGAYRVRVINKNGVSPASSAMITITEAQTPVPVVTEIYPLIAEIGAKTVLSILGENFDQEGDAVNLFSSDGIQTPLPSVIRHDPQTITAIIDVPEDFPEGQYHVQVINADGKFNEVSAVKIELCKSFVLQDDASAVTTTKIIRIENETIPATTTLTTDDRDEISTVNGKRSRIKLFIEPGSTFEIGNKDQTEWADYIGSIRPPKQIPSSSLILNELGTGSATISLGIDDILRLKNGATMFVLIEAIMPSGNENPSVYYVASGGDFPLAGMDGEWRGLVISQGGTVLSKRLNTPEDGLSTYTIGLLLTSMSDYVIGSKLFENPKDPFEFGGDDYGVCFVSTLNTANMVLMHGVVIFSVVILAFLYFKRHKR